MSELVAAAVRGEEVVLNKACDPQVRLVPVAQVAAAERKREADIVGPPAQLWTVAASLPNIHGDPVDRMLIAHALIGDFILVTIDAKIGSDPIRTVW